jgi:hypothetical protein
VIRVYNILSNLCTLQLRPELVERELYVEDNNLNMQVFSTSFCELSPVSKGMPVLRHDTMSTTIIYTQAKNNCIYIYSLAAENFQRWMLEL